MAQTGTFAPPCPQIGRNGWTAPRFIPKCSRTERIDGKDWGVRATPVERLDVMTIPSLAATGTAVQTEPCQRSRSAEAHP